MITNFFSVHARYITELFFFGKYVLVVCEVSVSEKSNKIPVKRGNIFFRKNITVNSFFLAKGIEVYNIFFRLLFAKTHHAEG
jgi:hypothetical protein